MKNSTMKRISFLLTALLVLAMVLSAAPAMAAAATRVGFTTQPAGAVAGTAFTTQPVVTLLDGTGVPLPGRSDRLPWPSPPGLVLPERCFPAPSRLPRSTTWLLLLDSASTWWDRDTLLPRPLLAA